MKRRSFLRVFLAAVCFGPFATRPAIRPRRPRRVYVRYDPGRRGFVVCNPTDDPIGVLVSANDGEAVLVTLDPQRSNP